jgi:hypothetical protein
MNAKITRTTRIGFGWTTGIIPGTTSVQDVTAPDYWGTIKTLQQKIANDRTYQLVRSGGTYYRTAMFVRVNGGDLVKLNTDSDAWDYLYYTDALYTPECHCDAVVVPTM